MTSATVSQIMEGMIAFSDGNICDINHLICVWSYAKTIGELEKLDWDTQFILEVAAITHDIACPLCRRKYGNAGGKLQEKEGDPLVRRFLSDKGLTEAQIERAAFLVGHHYTLAGIDGLDWQILVEADYIVNAAENGYSLQNICHFIENNMRTKAESGWLEAYSAWIRLRRVENMGFEIIQINRNTWRIEDDGVRLFLLTGTKQALLIDSGMNLNNARDIAVGLTNLPLSLLNTHADRDHIGSNEQFDAFYMHPAEEPVYRRSGKPGTVIPIREGDSLNLGDRELRIIHLPGHTPGSIAVLDVQNRVLISGDPIQEHGRVFMFGEHRNMEDYIASLEHLEGFTDQFDEIWPSHAYIPVSPAVIRKLHDGAQAILDGAVQGKPAELFGQSIVVYDLGFCTLLCGR